MINAEQITSRLRMMSDAELQRFAEMHKQDPYVFPLAFNESNMRKQMRTQAPQQQPQHPVNQQALESMRPALPEDQGIAALNPQMRFADGGLIGFAGGGESTSATYSRADDKPFGAGGTAYADGGVVRFQNLGSVPAMSEKSPYYSRSDQFRPQVRNIPGYAFGEPSTYLKPGPFASKAEWDEYNENPAAYTAKRQAEERAATRPPASVEAPPSVQQIPGYYPVNPLDTTTSAGFIPSAKAPAPEQPPAPQPLTKDVAFARMLQRESGNQQWNLKTGQPRTSSEGAVGVGQLLPGTAKDAAKMAGVEWNPDLFYRAKTGDPEKDQETKDYNLKLAKAYHGFLDKKYEGDQRKVAAAYNMGFGALDKVLADPKRRDNWREHIPDETKAYVSYVEGGDKGAAAPSTTAGISQLVAPTSAPSGAYTPEEIDYLAKKKFSSAPEITQMYGQRIKEQASEEAAREAAYQANRPEPESFKERRAAIEEDRGDVDKQQRMNEGLAWLTFASRLVQPGKTAIQALVEGAAEGTAQYSKAQGELKKAEKDRKMALAALAEAQRSAERGDFEKAQARQDAAAERMDRTKNAMVAAVAQATGESNTAALRLIQANMSEMGATERAQMGAESRYAIEKQQEAARLAAERARQEAAIEKEILDIWTDPAKKLSLPPNVQNDFQAFRRYYYMSKQQAQAPAGGSGSGFKFEGKISG